MKKILLLFSLLCSINIYSQMISDVCTNITDITFSIYEKNEPTLCFNKELSKFKVNNEKTLISFGFTIHGKNYLFDNDSLVLKLKHIQEKSKKWFIQSIELEISDFTKTITDDNYGKFIFYCYNSYPSFKYEIFWFLDDTLIAIFNDKLCSINKIIEHILCVNEYIELKKKEELIELKKNKEKQEKIDLLQ